MTVSPVETLEKAIFLHLFWIHNHCFHGIRFPPYHITFRNYDMSSPIAVTSQTLCLWIHVTIFNIKHMVLRQYTNIYIIATSVSVSVGSHTLWWWHNTHCIYIMGPTIFMEVYALYMTSHPRFMTSQNSIQFISLLYLISNWLYLTALPLYLCHHTQIINPITHIVHMTTQAQYVSHLMNTYDIISTLDDIIPRYDLHTHCIHVIIPRIPVIASTAAEPLYGWYHIQYICEIISPKYDITTLCVDDTTLGICVTSLYDIAYTLSHQTK